MLVDLIVADTHFPRFLSLIIMLAKLNSKIKAFNLSRAADNVVTIVSMPMPNRSGQTLLHVAAAQGRWHERLRVLYRL